jgi:hypothetical protein
VGELIAAGAFFVLAVAVIGGAALWADRDERKRRREAVAAKRAAVWEVAEAGAYDRTKVFVRKVTADGDELDRIAVAEVRNGHPDWDALIAEARATAASRAGLLNAKA